MNVTGAFFALILLPLLIIGLSAMIYYVSKPKPWEPRTESNKGVSQ